MVADPATIDPGLTAEQWWAQATEMMKEMNVLMGPDVLETEICIGGPETAHLSRAVAEALYAAGYNTPMAIMEMVDADMVLDLQDAGVKISRMQSRTIAAALRKMYTVVVYKGFMEALRKYEQAGDRPASPSVGRQLTEEDTDREVGLAAASAACSPARKGKPEQLLQPGEQEGQGAVTGESGVTAFQLQPPREACTPMGNAGGPDTTSSQGTDQSGGARKVRKVWAVRVGRQPGLYFSWDGPNGARRQVEGYSGNENEAFRTVAEAQRYMDDDMYDCTGDYESDEQDSDNEVEVSGKEGGAGVLLDGAA